MTQNEIMWVKWILFLDKLVFAKKDYRENKFSFEIELFGMGTKTT